MRRLLQVGAGAEPPVAAVGLSILKELFAARRTEIKQLVQCVDSQLKAKTAEIGDDAEEERFVDDDVAAAEKEAATEDISDRYKPMAREPRHAKAQHTPLWELFALASHVHPFVSHGATRLLSAETYEEVGENPFQEFSTGELLEQFAYASSKPRTKSGKEAAARLPYNSDKFMKKKNIQPHERFFHLYFKDSTVQKLQKRKAEARKLKEEDVDEEDGQSADDAEADEFFDAHIKEQMPKGDFDVDPDVDDDSDMDPDMDDFGEGGESDLDDDSGSAGVGNGGDFGSDASGGGSDDDDDDEDDSGDDESAASGRKAKRKALSDMTRKDQAAEIKKIKKQHSGALFASADDFDKLMEDEYGVM